MGTGHLGPLTKPTFVVLAFLDSLEEDGQAPVPSSDCTAVRAKAFRALSM